MNIYNNFAGLYEKSKTNKNVKHIFVQETFPTTLITGPKNNELEANEQALQQEAFNLFADTFGKCIIKRELWKNKLLREPNISFSDVVTISDEAFAIFTIERNWTIWKNELAGVAVTLRSGDYTTKNTNVKFGGWTRKGMDRFEEICQEVINVRRHFKERAEMENNYKKQKILFKAAKNTKSMKDLDNEVAQGRIVWNEFMMDNDVNDFPGTYVTTTTIYEAIIYSPLILKNSTKLY